MKPISKIVGLIEYVKEIVTCISHSDALTLHLFVFKGPVERLHGTLYVLIVPLSLLA